MQFVRCSINITLFCVNAELVDVTDRSSSFKIVFVIKYCGKKKRLCIMKSFCS